jgi:acyl-CoA thioesterase
MSANRKKDDIAEAGSQSMENPEPPIASPRALMTEREMAESDINMFASEMNLKLEAFNHASKRMWSEHNSKNEAARSGTAPGTPHPVPTSPQMPELIAEANALYAWMIDGTVPEPAKVNRASLN